MFSGKKGNIKKLQGWFADDIRNRLEIEFNAAEKKAEHLSISVDTNGGSSSSKTSFDNGDKNFQLRKLDTMKNLLQNTPEIVLNCIKKKLNVKFVQYAKINLICHFRQNTQVN